MARQTTIEKLGHDVVMDALIEKTLTEFIDDTVETIGDFIFCDNKNLGIVDLGAKSLLKIGTNAFVGCTNLDTLILRSETMPTVMSGTCGSTKIANGEGYIYVPSSWIDTFKGQSYVKSYINQVRALEDYTVDGTITGELDESKI